MPVPQWDFTVSDEPRFAPADYQSLEPCKALKPSGTDWRKGRYTGSGFLISDLIQGVWWYSQARRCGACRSLKTLCIYLDNDVEQFSCNVTIELFCTKCGKFTQYDGAD